MSFCHNRYYAVIFGKLQNTKGRERSFREVKMEWSLIRAVKIKNGTTKLLIFHFGCRLISEKSSDYPNKIALPTKARTPRVNGIANWKWTEIALLRSPQNDGHRLYSRRVFYRELIGRSAVSAAAAAATDWFISHHRPVDSTISLPSRCRFPWKSISARFSWHLAAPTIELIAKFMWCYC